MDERVRGVCEGGVDHLVTECPAVPRVEGSESRVGRSESTVKIAVAADGQIVVSVVDDGFELVEVFLRRSGTLEEPFPERLGLHEDGRRLIEVLPGGSTSEAACLAQVAFGGPHGLLRPVGVGFRLAELFCEWSTAAVAAGSCCRAWATAEARAARSAYRFSTATWSLWTSSAAFARAAGNQMGIGQRGVIPGCTCFCSLSRWRRWTVAGRSVRSLVMMWVSRWSAVVRAGAVVRDRCVAVGVLGELVCSDGLLQVLLEEQAWEADRSADADAGDAGSAIGAEESRAPS